MYHNYLNYLSKFQYYCVYCGNFSAKANQGNSRLRLQHNIITNSVITPTQQVHMGIETHQFIFVITSIKVKSTTVSRIIKG